MDKILELLKGRKSYIIAITTAVLGVLQALGLFTLPEWAYIILASAFGVALRASVDKVAEATKPK